MSRFAILSDEVGGDDKKGKVDKKVTKVEAVKAAVAAPAAAAAPAPKDKAPRGDKKEIKGPNGSAPTDPEDRRKKDTHNTHKRDSEKRPVSAAASANGAGPKSDKSKKDYKRKDQKGDAGDPKGLPKHIAQDAEKGFDETPVEDATSPVSTEDAAPPAAPEPPKKDLATYKLELAEQSAALPQKAGRSLESKAAPKAAAAASASEAPAKEKKTKTVFEDVQFGVSSSGPRPGFSSSAPRENRKLMLHSNNEFPALGGKK